MLPRRRQAIARTKKGLGRRSEGSLPMGKASAAAAAAASSSRRTVSTSDDDNDFDAAIKHDDVDDASDQDVEPVKKVRAARKYNGKASAATAAALHKRLFAANDEALPLTTVPPLRKHRDTYHRPALLFGESGTAGRKALLDWFDAVSETRGMPWRQPWIDPQTYDDQSKLRKDLAVRAYQVWISEIMLQQTRVAVVIDYWKRWMEKWPSMQELCAAEPDEVLSAWRGLGYYSRATRIHEAAKKVTHDKNMQGLLPSSVEELQAKVPGVGRYTGGAISAIVFGHAAPMVDGNVLRVLSRQLALHGNAKTDKVVVDTLWAAADALVKAVAQDGNDGQGVSDRPGRWGQALMELGSTICKPKPVCSDCPISATCRAYKEGTVLADKAGLMEIDQSDVDASPALDDIEDLCTLCEPFAGSDSDVVTEAQVPAAAAKEPSRGKRQATLSTFAFTSKRDAKLKQAEKEAKKKAADKIAAEALVVITDHAKKFPMQNVKKAVREEEALVCAIRRHDGTYLLLRRPDKGLLAGMWEFPSHTLPSSNDSTPAMRKERAKEYVAELTGRSSLYPHDSVLRHVCESGSVPWLFSHLKLTMHVQIFHFLDNEELGALDRPASMQRWAKSAQIEEESMGTGMRKCWDLVRDDSRNDLRQHYSHKKAA